LSFGVYYLFDHFPTLTKIFFKHFFQGWTKILANFWLFLFPVSFYSRLKKQRTDTVSQTPAMPEVTDSYSTKKTIAKIAKKEIAIAYGKPTLTSKNLFFPLIYGRFKENISFY